MKHARDDFSQAAKKHNADLVAELFRAIAANSRERLEDMIEAGAGLDSRDHLGRTPIEAAVDSGANACVHILMLRGADADVLSRDGGLAPLHKAAWNGQDGIVRMLLQHGADVNIKSRDGSTALHYAVAAAHDDIAQLLMDRHVDASHPDQYGDTAADIARNSGHDGLARRIVEHISHWHARRVKALRSRRPAHG